MLPVSVLWVHASSNTGAMHQSLTDHCIARPSVHVKGAHHEHKGAMTSVWTLLLSFLIMSDQESDEQKHCDNIPTATEVAERTNYSCTPPN